MSNVRLYLGPLIRGAIWAALLSLVAWAAWGYRQQSDVANDQALPRQVAHGVVRPRSRIRIASRQPLASSSTDLRQRREPLPPGR